MFCPIILRFISRSALGNLDKSSGGTVTLLTVARCCFNPPVDFFMLGVLFGALFATVLRLSGLKLVRSDMTGIWSWKNKKRTNIRWLKHYQATGFCFCLGKKRSKNSNDITCTKIRGIFNLRPGVVSLNAVSSRHFYATLFPSPKQRIHSFRSLLI